MGAVSDVVPQAERPTQYHRIADRRRAAKVRRRIFALMGEHRIGDDAVDTAVRELIDIYRDYAPRKTEEEDPLARDIRSMAFEAIHAHAQPLFLARLRKSTSDPEVMSVLNSGLYKAVERFDPTFPNPFLAFAASTMDGEYKRHIRDSRRAETGITRTMGEEYTAVTMLSNQGLTDEQICEVLGIDETEIERRRFVASRSVSTDVSEVGYIAEITGARRNFTPEDHLLGKALPPSVQASLQALAISDRDAYIMQHRLGLSIDQDGSFYFDADFVELSQTMIAEVLGISQVHVSRIAKRYLDIFKHHAPGNA